MGAFQFMLITLLHSFTYMYIDGQLHKSLQVISFQIVTYIEDWCSSWLLPSSHQPCVPISKHEEPPPQTCRHWLQSNISNTMLHPQRARLH